MRRLILIDRGIHGIMKQRAISTALLFFIVFLGYGIILQQHFKPHQTTRSISFTCIVALEDGISEFCVKGDPGASVQISIEYCDGSHLLSTPITAQKDMPNEYRWIWLNSPAPCTGKAEASAIARWQDGSQAETSKSFVVVKRH